MATITHPFSPADAFAPSSGFPGYRVRQGTNFPVPGLDFDAASVEAAFFQFIATAYGSGNLTVRIDWYADSASSGDVVWGAQIACITPNTDTQDIETDTLATASTATDTHLGTTGQRLHTIDITVSNLDSIAVGDLVTLRVYRDAAAGGDTMTGDATIVAVNVSYSDT
jgi:hypothetical protein